MIHITPRTIAIFLNTEWNIYNFRLPVLRKLQDEGYRIVAIAPRDSFSEKIEEAGFRFYHIGINNKGTNPLEDIKLTTAVCRLFRQIKPDLLLHYTIKSNIYGSIAARWAGMPVISNVSGLGAVFLSSGLSSRITQKLYRFALRGPEKFFKTRTILNALSEKNLYQQSTPTFCWALESIRCTIYRCKNQIRQTSLLSYNRG